MGSRQYKVVLKKLQALTERLQQAKEVDTLLLKFKMEEWMARVATATANELVLLALDRIKNKATDYDVFIRMLLSMPGAKSLAEEMKGTNCTFHKQFWFSEDTHTCVFIIMYNSLHLPH